MRQVAEIRLSAKLNAGLRFRFPMATTDSWDEVEDHSTSRYLVFSPERASDQAYII